MDRSRNLGPAWAIRRGACHATAAVGRVSTNPAPPVPFYGRQNACNERRIPFAERAMSPIRHEAAVPECPRNVRYCGPRAEGVIQRTHSQIAMW